MGGVQEEEEEEDLWSDDDDARTDDTDDTSTVTTTLGESRPPDGFEIVDQCPLPDVRDRTHISIMSAPEMADRGQVGG